MADDDDATTRDGTPSATGYRVSPSVVQQPGGSRYRRGEEIARGGLGRITEAYDERLQRQVAIKELHHRTEQGRRRFELESLTTARLQHPSIVSVLDSGTWDSGDPFLVLQLLEGTTLAEEIAARPTLDARLALLPSLLSIADALGYAHEQGVVHRDVKPSNIMIGPHGETVILDWGVAHDRARPLAPDQDVLVGTPRFMSPEQARCEPPVPAFDVYSLGATLAAVLSGKQPFADVTAEAIVDRLRAGATDVPALPAEVPADLAAIVAKATGAQTRYAHAGEVASDLRRFIAGKLVGARRYTKRELFVRWVRRNRVLVAATTVVVIIGAIAVGSVILQRNAAIAERGRAVARANDLILLHARSRMRTDPTATIAWLAEYPPSAPHQDELLALVDEAAGRMVAKHVWYPPSPIADAAFAADGALIVATRDGAIVRLDAVTGARRQLAKLPATPLHVKVRGARTVALDDTGGVWRVDGGLVRLGTVEASGELTGLFIAPDDGVKVTFARRDAVWVGEPLAKHADLVAVDHETDSRTVVGLTASGELVAGNPVPQRMARFPPRTVIRVSENGSHYVALAHEPDGSSTLWLGTLAAPPAVVVTLRACADDEQRGQYVKLTNDGRTVVVVRCGVLAVYDTVARRPLPVPDPDHVKYTTLSPDGRWLVIGHVSGFELIELSTGAARRIETRSMIRTSGFSPDGRSLFAADLEQGIRLWVLPAGAAPTGRIDAQERSTIILARAGELDVSLRRRLECAVWSATEKTVIATARLALDDVRDPDHDARMYPQSVSADGRTCAFAARDGRTIVVAADGTKRTISTPADRCLVSADGHTAACAGAALFTVELATDRVLSSRVARGQVRDLVRFRDATVALVAEGTTCRLETFTGQTLATFTGAGDCFGARAVDDTAVLVARPNRTLLWTDRGMFDVAAGLADVEPAPTGDRVAVVNAEHMEIVDLRTSARVAGPPAHERVIVMAAWSSTGILASSDDETIQLWDAATQRTRIIVALHATKLAWSRDGRTLYASDGRVVHAWPIDIATGAGTADVRARIAELTTARIVDGRASTP